MEYTEEYFFCDPDYVSPIQFGCPNYYRVKQDSEQYPLIEQVGSIEEGSTDDVLEEVQKPPKKKEQKRIRKYQELLKKAVSDENQDVFESLNNCQKIKTFIDGLERMLISLKLVLLKTVAEHQSKK